MTKTFSHLSLLVGFEGGGGGGPGQSDKKALTTFSFSIFSPQLILQKSNLIPKKTIIFKVPEGSNFFQGRSNFFQGGGGVQLLIPC